MSENGIVSSIELALDVLAATPATLRGMLAGLPDAAVIAPADGDWSARDVVAHLTSLHPLTLVGRVRLLLDEDEPAITAIDEQQVLDESGLRSRPIGEILDEMARGRKDTDAWLRALTPVELARTGRHSIIGALSVGEIIHHKAWHDLQHAQQIARMLSGPLDAGSGGMRQFH